MTKSVFRIIDDFKTELRSANRARSKGALRDMASAFMERLAKSPVRVMNYFKHAAVRFDAEAAI